MSASRCESGRSGAIYSDIVYTVRSGLLEFNTPRAPLFSTTFACFAFTCLPFGFVAFSLPCFSFCRLFCFRFTFCGFSGCFCC